MRLQEAIGRNLRARRHTAFLLTIVAMFAVRPFLGDTDAATIVYSLVLLLMLFVGLLTIHIEIEDLAGEQAALLAQHRRRIFVGWALAVPAIAARLWLFFAPNPRLYLVGSVSWLLFFSFLIWNQSRNLLKQREVTGDTINMSISIYLLLGLNWALLYFVIFTHDPEAFHFATPASVSEADSFPILLYFSLTTLSTVGFGDITPLTLQARYAAVAEGITGQLYLTILVARLVGMYMSRAATPSTSAPAHDRRTENPDR